MRRTAEFVLRHRLLVVLCWLVVVVVGGMAYNKATDRMTIDFSLPGQPGADAANQIDREFQAGGKTAPYLLVVTMPEGETVTGNEDAIARAFDAVPAHLAELDPPVNMRVVDEENTGDREAFRSDDDRTAFAMGYHQFIRDPLQPFPTEDIRDALREAAPPGAATGVTGEDALASGDEETGPGVLVELLIGGIGALAVLIFVFASFLALLPLVVAVASIMASFIMLWPLTYAFDVSFIVQFLIALIGLGVAIDYSLILVNRWREEREHGRSNHDAVVVAMETAGRAVVFSGITVAIGLAALLVLPVPFMRSIGIGGALIPVASVLTTLTLTPAILGSIGPRVDWPRIRHEGRASRAWSRWAAWVVRRRFVAAGLATAVLAALFAGFLGVKIGLASSDSLASQGPSYEALQTLERGGVTTGVLTPIEVITNDGAEQAVADELSDVPGIATALVPDDDAHRKNGHRIVTLIPDEETVNSTSIEPVRNVKDAVEDDPEVLGVAGFGADQIDFLKAVYGNFPLMLGLIVLLTLILLARAFRSVLLPIKAVILNLITLGATLGFIVLFWQNGYGSDAVFGLPETGAVTFWLPMMIFAFLYGISMDYEVFILARIREEYDRGDNTDHAVIEGIGRTGRLITSAALILCLAFIALTAQPQTDLKVFATALAFGILLDATIVRSVLVPALVSMFGKWNWWMPPSVAKVLRVEPSTPHSEATALAD